MTYQEICRFCKNRRTEMNISLYKMAKLIGVARQNLTLFEKGEQAIKVTNFMKYLNELGLCISFEVVNPILPIASKIPKITLEDIYFHQEGFNVEKIMQLSDKQAKFLEDELCLDWSTIDDLGFLTTGTHKRPCLLYTLEQKRHIVATLNRLNEI